MKKNGYMLKIDNLKVYFALEKTLLDKLFSGRHRRFVHAVDDVSLRLKDGQTLGLVGESGSGKTTLGSAILGLVDITNGEIYFQDRKISGLDKEERRKLLCHIQMVFQDPFSSLNPCMRVRNIIGRQFKLTGLECSENEMKKRILNVIESVGLSRDDLDKYPHEFSGGQKQRICLARAIAPSPELIIADEITSALDVSIQSQILGLLLELKSKINLSIIYITHDLRVARLITDYLAVMYLGRIIEYGKVGDVFNSPLHPYTKALLSAIPKNKYEYKVSLKGAVPSAIELPIGCRLYNRCPYRMPICEEIYPDLEYKSNEHMVSCHLYSK
jgi:oligopeptide/dipeptide ABC transporter ATP-binding protein